MTETILLIILIILAIIGTMALFFTVVWAALKIVTSRGMAEVQSTIISCLYSPDFEKHSVADLRTDLKDSLGEPLILKVRLAAERLVDGKGK